MYQATQMPWQQYKRLKQMEKQDCYCAHETHGASISACPHDPNSGPWSQLRCAAPDPLLHIKLSYSQPCLRGTTKGTTLLFLVVLQKPITIEQMKCVRARQSIKMQSSATTHLLVSWAYPYQTLPDRTYCSGPSAPHPWLKLSDMVPPNFLHTVSQIESCSMMCL